MPTHKNRNPGFKIKRKRSKKSPLPKNVTDSRAYKVEKKRSKRGYSTGGFKFGRTTTSAPPKDKSKDYAAVSRKMSGGGKNEKQIKEAIAKMKIKEPVTTMVSTKGTLGNKPIIVRKKRIIY